MRICLIICTLLISGIVLMAEDTPKIGNMTSLFEPAQVEFPEFASVKELKNYINIPAQNKTLLNQKDRKILLASLTNGPVRPWKRYITPSILPASDFIEKFAQLCPASKTHQKEDLIFLSYKYSGSEFLVIDSLDQLVLFIRYPEKTFAKFPRKLDILKNINTALDIVLNKKKISHPQFYPSKLDEISLQKNGIIEASEKSKKHLALKLFAAKKSVSILIKLPVPAKGLSNTYFADLIRRSKEPLRSNLNPEHIRPRPELELRRAMMFPPFTKNVKKYPIAFINTKKENDIIFRVGDEKYGYKILSIIRLKGNSPKWRVKVKNIKTGKMITLEK